MEDIRITGLEIVRNPRLTQSNNMILAYFSADIGVFSFKGCTLVRTARQGIAAWLPRLDDQRANRNRSVTLHDEPTRHALLRAAREMYIRMGGTGAEWRPRDTDWGDGLDTPLHPHRGCDAEGWPTHPDHPNYNPPEESDLATTRPRPIELPAELPAAITSMMVPARRTIEVKRRVTGGETGE